MRPLVLALALVACGGGDDDDSSSSSSSSSGSTAGSTSSTSTSSSSSGAASSTSSSGDATSSSSTTSSSGSPAVTANVTGAWAGAVGNDGSYLDLTQTGASVTGTACTQPGKSCFPITDGAVSGDRFTGKYATGTDAVTMDMKVAADNRSMQGTYAMTKCGCTEQVALGKQN